MSLRKTKVEKSYALSDLLNRLRSRAAPTRRAHKETQTPSPCESTLAVEFGLSINFIIAHLNRTVARLRISLSSGISMFARER